MFICKLFKPIFYTLSYHCTFNIKEYNKNNITLSKEQKNKSHSDTNNLFTGLSHKYSGIIINILVEEMQYNIKKYTTIEGLTITLLDGMISALSLNSQ